MTNDIKIKEGGTKMTNVIIANVLTNHAIERAVERLNINEAIAKDYVLYMLHNSVDQGIFGNARTYLHEATGTRILVDLNEPVVITLYSNHEAPPNKITNARLQAVLEAELREIIQETTVDIDFLQRQLDRMASQVLTLEIESHCCNSEGAHKTLQCTVTSLLNSMANIEAEINASMAVVEQVDAEIRAVCSVAS